MFTEVSFPPSAASIKKIGWVCRAKQWEDRWEVYDDCDDVPIQCEDQVNFLRDLED